jgi:hypothetical protein
MSRAYQKTVDFISTCPQTEANDHDHVWSVRRDSSRFYFLLYKSICLRASSDVFRTHLLSLISHRHTRVYKLEVSILEKQKNGLANLMRNTDHNCYNIIIYYFIIIINTSVRLKAQYKVMGEYQRLKFFNFTNNLRHQ